MKTSNDIAISVRDLKKFYHFHKTPYQNLGTVFKKLLPRQGDSFFDAEEANKLIWPLKGVSFEVKKGEAVALVGKNGVGKSTLLKILAQITAPSSGTIDIYGQVTALLEVGAGFHSELTGRENVYLSGTLLGIPRKQIGSALSQIVEFSEIGRFLDMPVKHYSKGMYLRLAFSVAVHLRPSILLLDEVFSVGDPAFQEKCMKRMFQLHQEGTTILFVTHSMDLVQRAATRAIYLEDGLIASSGPPEIVVEKFLNPTPLRSLS